MIDLQPAMQEPSAHAPIGGQAAPGVIVVGTLLMILFVPAATFYLVGTSSMAPGVLVVALALIAMQTVGLTGVGGQEFFKRDLTLSLIVVVLLSVHLVVRALAVEVDTTKAAGSLLIALAAIIGCGAASTLFSRAGDGVVRAAVMAAMAVLLLSAVFSLAGIQPPSETATSKPTFPFTEPSHFAGVLLPVIAFLAVTGSGWRRWAWILTAFALGYLLENLSIVVGSVVVAVACLAATRLAVFGAIAILILPFLDLTYFLDRIEFDPAATTNLSSLVYIQGWELIRAGLSDTYGWGLGFQQLGFTFLDAPTSDLIYRLNGGSDLNLREGSFGLAKLVSELGIFGLAIVLCHGFLAGKALLGLRRVAIAGDRRPFVEILAMCSIYTFVIDMYVRGTGYFSGPAFLAVTSVFLLHRLPSSRTLPAPA